MSEDSNLKEVFFDVQGRSDSVAKLDFLSQSLSVEFKLSTLILDNDKSEMFAHGQGFDPQFQYGAVYVPELRDLTGYFDRIMVFSDGLVLKVFLLQNNLDQKSRELPTLKKLEEVGKACHKYTGSTSGQKMPVIFRIVILSDQPLPLNNPLKTLRRLPGLKKVDVRSIYLDLSAQSIWSNSFLNGLFLKKKVYYSAMKNMKEGKAIALPQDEMPIMSQAEKPILTYAMIATFSIIFGLELFLSKSFKGPDISTLVSMGAVSHGLVFNFGEVYRLFTAALLHGSYLHLLLNSVALFYVGPTLEVFLGRRWVFSVFAISVLGGSLGSIFFSSDNNVSVGASGGIMGLIAALFVVSFRLPSGADKTTIQMNATYMLFPALLPIFSSLGGAKIDYAAHIGGAIAGALLAFIIYQSWKNKSAPGLSLLSMALTVLFSFVFVTSVSWGVFNYDKIRADISVEEKFLPQENYKLYYSNPEKYKLELDEWAQKWPEDPIVPYFQASEAIKDKNIKEAEEKLTLALALQSESGSKYGRGGNVGEIIRMTLVALLIDEQRKEEAKKIAEPLCKEKSDLPEVISDICL